MLVEAIPVRTVRAHCTDKPWMTPNIKALIKARQRTYTKGETPKYKSLHAKVTKLISNAKAMYYKSKAEGSHQSNPAKWYKTMYKLAAATENQQSLSSPDHADLMEIADRLQRSFTKPWLGIQPDLPRLQAVEHLLKDSHPPLPSIGQVKTVLKHLNSRKATGSDNIPAWCLKRPIPKIRPPTDLDSDFHQVSVLPQLAKVIEKLQLQLNKSSFKIKTNQHAFTSGHSTVSALTSISQNWFDSTDNSSTGRQGVHALFVDFRKAFDFVDHKILLDKLADMNVTRSFWLWMMSFLEGRTQQDLKWNKHVEETTRKAAKNLYCLRECRRANLPVEVGLTTYLTKIRPILEYCSPVWGGLPRYLKDELERVQKRSLRIIGLPHGYLPTLEERRIEATSRELDTILGDPSHIFYQRTMEHNKHNYNLRRRDGIVQYAPFSGTERHRNSFIPRAMRKGLH
ncbi:Hypothetical predicted protein [Paramuricea clavata]|uniref:Reverse transcriptase domain-containing protein n=1 Tax=Paramuricea clavata TaxID=317549 RepID=A0A6S7HQM5_PARCT|nr:Hypothetical predicted protein [Paramuricea clavata]